MLEICTIIAISLANAVKYMKCMKEGEKDNESMV